MPTSYALRTYGNMKYNIIIFYYYIADFHVNTRFIYSIYYMIKALLKLGKFWTVIKIIIFDQRIEDYYRNAKSCSLIYPDTTLGFQNIL